MDKQTIISKLDIKSFYSSELPSIKWNGSGMAQALCPFHEDTKPSLSINLNTGQFKCFGCDKKGSIFDFYMLKQGVDYKTAFNALAKEAGLSTEPQKRLIKTYDYVDESGNLIFQTVRYEPKDFKQRRPDGKGGWIYNLQGVQLVPYNLPEVIKAKSVIICEGEKDVEKVSAIGLTASCNPMGAGKWKPDYNQYFKGKKVVIIPDNDKAGRDHALQVAKNLKGIAESIKVITLPDLKGKDVTDWIQAGGTKERLIEIIKDTPEIELSEFSNIGGGQTDTSKIDPLSFLKKGSDLQALECHIEWCVEKLLPKQSITLLHGRGGIGKTWLSLILADAISRGNEFMGLSTQKMPVVFVDFENSMPVLVDRVKKIGIEDAFFWHNTNEVLKPPKLDKGEWTLYKVLPPDSLLIFDTLRASQGQDENDSQKMAFVISRLKELRDMGFTILLLHHTPKGNDKTYKGSTAILDLSDHVLSLHKVRKTNPEGDEVDNNEDDYNCYYRLGTKDKTRYEPFHIFMTFDKEKGFIKASDPDDEDLQVIHSILEEKKTLNQKQIFDILKEELDIKSKGKVINLLRKGEGKYWTSHRVKNAVYYEAIGSVQVSTPIYRTDGHFSEDPLKTVQTDNNNNTLQSLDSSTVSECPAMPQTVRTDEIIDLTGDDVEVIL